MKKHYTIPFFMPHKGCPFTCVFCRQDKITGKERSISPRDIAPTIEDYLKTVPGRGACIEVGFFGGSFTGLDKDMQRRYLQEVRPFLKTKAVRGLRLSTRPDYIDHEILCMLKELGVTRIELGVQSMSDNILKRAKRGHSSVDVKKASKLILKYGFGLGHQLMVGLPASLLRDEIATAKLSIQLGASEVRIYPVIVIKETELARMWKKGRYKPLTEEEAVRRCAKLIRLFESRNVRVIRCGLHPSEGLLSGREIVAGPFHEAFRQKVETHIYLSLFEDLFKDKRSAKAVKNIYYNPVDAAYIIGYERSNAKYIETILKRRVLFSASRSIRPKSVKIKFEDGGTAILKRGGQEDAAAP